MTILDRIPLVKIVVDYYAKGLRPQYARTRKCLRDMDEFCIANECMAWSWVYRRWNWRRLFVIRRGRCSWKK